MLLNVYIQFQISIDEKASDFVFLSGVLGKAKTN